MVTRFDTRKHYRNLEFPFIQAIWYILKPLKMEQTKYAANDFKMEINLLTNIQHAKKRKNIEFLFATKIILIFLLLFR